MKAKPCRAASQTGRVNVVVVAKNVSDVESGNVVSARARSFTLVWRLLLHTIAIVQRNKQLEANRALTRSSQYLWSREIESEGSPRFVKLKLKPQSGSIFFADAGMIESTEGADGSTLPSILIPLQSLQVNGF